MAGNWIKVEYVTPDKPELSHVMRRCNCSRAEAFLAWFRTWSWLDAVTDEAYMRGTQPGDVDEKAQIPGFAQALEEAGWLQFDKDGMAIVHWDRHNGQSAKKRAQGNSRMDRFRR